MAPPQYRRSGKYWFVGDGFVWDDWPEDCRMEPGRPHECSSRLLVFNPGGRTARVKVRFFHVDRSPTSIECRVGGGRIESIELATLPEVPHKQAFWIAVEADRPVLPQARHEDYSRWDPVPDAMIATAPYPGPLEDETSWIYPDCYQSAWAPSGRKGSWYERELVTILNPNEEPVKARVRYFLRQWDGGGEEEIEVPGKRVVALDVWERHPLLLGERNGPPVRVCGDYAMRIDATGPIVTQKARRCRWTGQPDIVGARSTMGFPLRGRGHRRWHYPGGAIVDRDILPREQNCDVTWNLLFIHNLDARQRARARIRFHREDGSVRESKEIVIPPLKSDLEWLHLEPWLGQHAPLNDPWAMTVTADRPVVPDVTCAEFEMWSQVCPGAMSAVNFYPGPLRDERVWWLGIGPQGGADHLNIEWQQGYHLFNPGRRKVEVELAFLGAGRVRTHAVEVPAGGVRRVESGEVDGLPLHEPFAVRATGDRPFCAQVFVRAFTRGLRPTRSMYAAMGVPVALR